MTDGRCGGPRAPSQVVSAERAVFTSLRTPTGEGYRIVAASGRIGADEKRQITRCAPSHGSMCDSSPGATALASFVLDGGQRCLFLSKNGEVEHTARGGHRVCTHVLLIDPAGYRQFNCDPFSVAAVALPEVGGEPEPSAARRLEPLALRVPLDAYGRYAGPARESGAPPVAAPARDDSERLIALLAAILSEHAAVESSGATRSPAGAATPAPRGTGPSLIVLKAPTPRDALGWVLAATPAAVREHLSLSYGLRFTPARRFNLVLTDAKPNELERMARDRDVSVIRWEATAAPADGPFEPWLHFVRRGWKSGRGDDVARVAAELSEGCTPQVLEQTVRLVEDTDRARTADAPRLRELVRHHLTDGPPAGVPERLLAEFRRVSDARQAALAKPEHESSPEGASTVGGRD
jgi:hypothetical protein